MIETKFKQTEIGQIPEDWEPIKIENNFFLKGRIGWQGLKASEFKQQGPFLVTGTDFLDGKIDWSKCYHITMERYLQDKKLQIQPGDILITKDGTIGKLAYIDIVPGLVSLNSHLLIIRPLNNSNILNEYVFYHLKGRTFSNYVSAVQTGTTMASLTQQKVAIYKLPLPPFEEQERIASALSSIDNLLASLDKLIAKKRDIKQGAMQQLLTGKTRLPGFTEPWIECSIGKDCSVKARIGWQGLTTAEYLSHGSYGLITSTDIVDYKVNWDSCCYVSKFRYSQDPNIIVRNGDILISKDGTIGKVAIVNNMPYPCTLNSGVFVIRSVNQNISQEGLSLAFISPYFKDFIKRLTAGSTIVHLYQKDIVNFTFPMPSSIAEQQAIASVLTAMDNEIASLEAKRKKYEAVKQGMMQQLLTGKIRLINQSN